MKNILLAPAVAVVAGSMTFAGPAAFATTVETPEAQETATEEATDPVDEPTEEPAPGEGEPTEEPAPGEGEPTEEPTPGEDEPTEEPTPGEDETETPEDSAPEVSAEETLIRVTPFIEDGFTINYTNLKPGATYNWKLVGESGKEFTGTFTAEEANGSFIVSVPEDTDPESLFGHHMLTVTDEDGMEVPGDVAFTVVTDEYEEPADDETPGDNQKPGDKGENKSEDDSDEEVVQYALKVTPKELTVSDFVNKKDKKGVTLSVTGLQPKEQFTVLVVKQSGGNVLDFKMNVTADEKGNWSKAIYGQAESGPLEGFVGEYKVTVKSEQGTLNDTFNVTNPSGEKDDAEAGSNDMKQDEGNTLPRTGAELTGLVAGGVLVAVGAATVLVTRRRVK